MDFLVEALIQIVVEFIAEVLLEGAYHGVARVLRSTHGRTTLTVLLGLGFGLAWGAHLDDRTTPPRLMWISLALAAVAGVLILRRAGRGHELERPDEGWVKRALTPPWRWAVPRLVGFLALNLAIAAGVAVGYTLL